MMRRDGINSYRAVMSMENRTGTRAVKELLVQSFVKSPIGLQALLRTKQQVVVIVKNLLVGKVFRPQAELIYMTDKTAK